MQYQVVTAESSPQSSPARALTTEVNALIEEGWRPLGPAQMFGQSPGRMRICQTMVKDDDDEAKLNEQTEQILKAIMDGAVKDDEAVAKMTEQIEALIRLAKAND